MMKWIWRSLLAVVLLIAVVAVAGLVYREVVQSRAEAQLTITTPNGIDDALYVPIRRSEQWITIRGRDKSNPVVLIIHGGPGFANAPLVNAMLPYEQSYTLVQWDQPGAAKTFRRAGNTLPADLTYVGTGQLVSLPANEALACARVRRAAHGRRRGTRPRSFCGREASASAPAAKGAAR
jgi:pimeloyl-ACP methyl ester carboxylesterase